MLPTGRIERAPAALLEEAVLAQRFDWEARQLLRHYVWIELAHLAEYARMGLLDADAAGRVRAALLDLTPGDLAAERTAAMSDPLFALERAVQSRLPEGTAPAWHVDRSRNDVQACAQLMLGRERLQATAAGVRELARTAVRVAAGHTTSLMPGYTQHQSAHPVTLGFYLAALAEAATGAAESMNALADAVNLCPLGAGALAGLELPWDRRRLADALGFAAPQPHALTSVASRAWVLRSAAELAVLGTTLSRFLTDLLWWSGASCRFLDLPDELAGISSAMPHKRNFPVLERARGMTGHLVGLATDLMIGQRNTGYTNLVEVSKESTRFLEDLFSTGDTMLRLTETAVAGLRLRAGRAARAAGAEPSTTSTVANRLTLEHGVPARTAQVAVGRWIAAAARGLGEDAELTPGLLTAAGLTAACAALGHDVPPDEPRLRADLDAATSLERRVTDGSTRPDRVERLLAETTDRLAAADLAAATHTARLQSAHHRTTLATPTAPIPTAVPTPSFTGVPTPSLNTPDAERPS
ncbi:Argininosuccinate lyase 1 [Nonomuraea coxensis DSM 45129]|uniref:argininosuccinate lyase n=1 Tax=Nonomuraea coxensis DSM 45129 TaxID=1122611 RepID=A0ABX8U4M7_9ACTN|nr:lyase family protein [Nonomuraea coxensis]QYC41608.1 Argininosuccinate lyase 1 [Nonomuraea coxensis DSM 45129]